MLYRWNLPGLCISMSLSFAQMLGRRPYGARGRDPETSENQPQNEVFGLISSNFQYYLKNCNIWDVNFWSAVLFQIWNQSDCIRGT